MDAIQTAKWRNPQRKPFCLFKTVEEELAAGNQFWASRTPQERMEYLNFMRCVIFGEEVINAPMVRCYGWRKMNEEGDSRNVVYL